MDIRGLSQQFQKVTSGSDTSLQTHVLKSLLSELQQFVTHINEEKKLVAQTSQIRKQANIKPSNPTEEVEQREAEELLREVAKVKNKISAKQMMLRRLEVDVESLLREIKRAL